jgi:hypothetical protein
MYATMVYSEICSLKWTSIAFIRGGLRYYGSVSSYWCTRGTSLHVIKAPRALALFFLKDTHILFRADSTHQNNILQNTRNFHVHIVTYFCDSLVFLERKSFCAFFMFVCVYLQCWRSNYQERKFGVSNRNISTIFVCTSPSPDFQRNISWSFVWVLCFDIDWLLLDVHPSEYHLLE